MQTLRRPEPVTNVPVGVAVLLVSAALEGLSWRTARRQLRAEAAARHLDLGEYLVTSSDPTPAAVFLEDSAALLRLLSPRHAEPATAGWRQITKASLSNATTTRRLTGASTASS